MGPVGLFKRKDLYQSFSNIGEIIVRFVFVVTVTIGSSVVFQLNNTVITTTITITRIQQHVYVV